MAVGESSLPAGLRFLLQRRSVPRLVAPAPSDEELELMLRAACRAPDFQHLRPYRFLLVRGEGLARLGQAMQRAAIRSGQPPEVVERAPQLPDRAPLVVISVFCPKPSSVVSLLDQQLCAGGATLSLQLAANVLGYAGIWRSGWLTTAVAFTDELKLLPGERVTGILYLGTAPSSGAEPTEIAQESSLLDEIAAWV